MHVILCAAHRSNLQFKYLLRLTFDHTLIMLVLFVGLPVLSRRRGYTRSQGYETHLHGVIKRLKKRCLCVCQSCMCMCFFVNKQLVILAKANYHCKNNTAYLCQTVVYAIQYKDQPVTQWKKTAQLQKSSLPFQSSAHEYLYIIFLAFSSQATQQ